MGRNHIGIYIMKKIKKIEGYIWNKGNAIFFILDV